MDAVWFYRIFLLYCSFVLQAFASEDEGKEQNVPDAAARLQGYIKLFNLQRAEHVVAVKNIVELESYEKQFKMVELVLQKLFVVMEENKAALMAVGFTPGDPVPEDKDVRNAFSVVLENTAILGDILLRLPRITHIIYDRKNDWHLMTKWAVGFCNDSKVFDEGNNAKLLHLMAQELNLVEHDPNYVNPYKSDDDLDKMINDELKRRETPETKTKKKKAKKEKRKGPRLSRSEL